jgi:hypothetical protein
VEGVAESEGLGAAIVLGIQQLLESQGKAPSLLLKTVHDYYNREGALVRNAQGTTWKTVGDARLGSSPQTAEIAGQASRASRDAVEDMLRSGASERAEAALDLIPRDAAIPGGPFVTVEEFSVDPRAWDFVLRRSLSPDPAVNDLFQIVKGNLGPIVSLKARQFGRSVVQTAEGVVDSVGEGIDTVLSWPGRIEAEIEHMFTPRY